MKRLLLFINSLEERERYVLIGGLYAVIIIVGIFFITSYMLTKIDRLEKKLSREINNYVQLQKIVQEYKQYKPTVKPVLSLTKIEEIAMKVGAKSNIVSIKPYQQGEFIEISFEKLSADQISRFLRKIKENGYIAQFIDISDPKGNGQYNMRVILGTK
ncbi:type II secretion system protein GspM [Persephonella sp. IF05-L8]|uniref:type II secretion system protein GspM n=1 Tax=Persephonella sp. IF05-L8 TaxID=1158338 RepID=UPI00049828D3